MKRQHYLYILFLIIGVILGTTLPVDVFSPCREPVLSVCKHSFGDWTLRITQTVATLLAVVVAIYKEDIQRKLFRPIVNLDTSNTSFAENTTTNSGRTTAISYSAKMTLRNNGKHCASNMSIIIERIIYKREMQSQTPQDIITDSFNLLSDSGDESIRLPIYDEISIKWFEIFGPHEEIINGRRYSAPMTFAIGSFQIPQMYHNGIIEVVVKIKYDDSKPQRRTIRLEWNGEWKERHMEMSRILSYQWIS